MPLSTDVRRRALAGTADMRAIIRDAERGLRLRAREDLEMARRARELLATR